MAHTAALSASSPLDSIDRISTGGAPGVDADRPARRSVERLRGSSSCSIGCSASSTSSASRGVRQLDRSLQDHRPRVHAAVDEVDGHAEHLHPVVERLLTAWSPGNAGSSAGWTLITRSGNRGQELVRRAAACSRPAPPARRRARSASRRSRDRAPSGRSSLGRKRARLYAGGIGASERAAPPGLSERDRDDARSRRVRARRRAVPAGWCLRRRRGPRRSCRAQLLDGARRGPSAAAHTSIADTSRCRQAPTAWVAEVRAGARRGGIRRRRRSPTSPQYLTPDGECCTSRANSRPRLEVRATPASHFPTRRPALRSGGEGSSEISPPPERDGR